jgi:hypothetical protein
MPAAPLDQGLAAEHVADRGGQGLAAVQDKQHAPLGVQAAVTQPGHQPGADRGVLGRALNNTEGNLGAVGGDTERADQQVLTHREAVEEDDQPAVPTERAAQERSEPLGGRGHEAARDRRVRGARRGLLDAGADRLEPDRVATGGQPAEHSGDHAVGEQIRRGERLIGRHGQFVLVVADRAHPRSAHADPAATKGHGAVLAAVPLGGPGRVVLALGSGEVGDLDFHQLGHDLQADRDRRGQQPLAHVFGEPGQMPVQSAGQPLGQPERGRRDQPQPVTSSDLVERTGRVGVLHPGSSSSDLAVLGASHVRRSGEDPTSNPTNPGTTSKPSLAGPPDSHALWRPQAMWVLSGIEGLALYGAAFPQVTAERQGRRDAF